MRTALLLSAILVLGTTSLASAQDNGRRYRQEGPRVYVNPPRYVPAPRYYGPPAYDDYYGQPRRYYDDDYYDDRRPGFGIDIPGGPSIRIRP